MIEELRRFLSKHGVEVTVEGIETSISFPFESKITRFDAEWLVAETPEGEFFAIPTKRIVLIEGYDEDKEDEE